MKKYLAIIISMLFISMSTAAYAVTTTPSPEPSVTKQEKLIDQINNLREKVASKVAELNLVEKRGIIVTVDEVSGNKITGTDIQDDIRITDVDELTKFSSPSAKTSFGISDISKGSLVGIIGLYNKQSKRILARFIDVISLPVFINGVIQDVDKVNFTVTILSENNVRTIVDIENITRTSTYTTDNGLVKSGFSKIQVGQRGYVVGYPQQDEKNRITGSRIIVFPDTPKNPAINLPEAASSDSVDKTATGSGSTVKPKQ